MVRTQIQLPDELYRRVKQFAAQREWSLAEVVRRSIEEMFDRYPAQTDQASVWRPPAPRVLGCRPLDEAALKRLSQEEDARL
jgi:hypothetical protein